MTKFFEKINYSASNEDSFSEIEALSINENDEILCITASGARSLDLLTCNPKRIISIDFNSTQNYLLELKVSWYKYLNYDEFISFMWINNNFDRIKIYNKIKENLSKESKFFWDNNKKIILSWIVYSWTWEKVLIFISKFSFTRKKMLKKLFSFNNIEDQKKYWKVIWCNSIFKIFLKLCCSRFLWEYIIREPWVKLIKRDYNIYKHIKEKLDNLANNFLLKDNDFANLIFLWEYKYSLPIHLKKEYFDIIKSRVDKIEVKTIWLSEILDDKDLMKNITAISLSDFWSYADNENYNNIWKKIVQNCNSWLKFCERQALVIYNPEKLLQEIKRNNKLEEEIWSKDKTVFYTFCIWKILKS